MGIFQTPYTNNIPVPDASGGEGVASRGGYDLPDGRKESDNLSELPKLPDFFSVPGGPSKGETVAPSKDVGTGGGYIPGTK